PVSSSLPQSACDIRTEIHATSGQKAHLVLAYRAGTLYETSEQIGLVTLANSNAELTPVDAAYERTRQIFAGRGYYAVTAAINHVTASQVEEAAARFASNLSIAAYGNIASVPRRDQL
ncbi:hypothetical protein PMAYCL1PPCAC_20166, partial [Pristionchus mayeri]